jgi:hypothetical protein
VKVYKIKVSKLWEDFFILGGKLCNQYEFSKKNFDHWWFFGYIGKSIVISTLEVCVRIWYSRNPERILSFPLVALDVRDAITVRHAYCTSDALSTDVVVNNAGVGITGARGRDSHD